MTLILQHNCTRDFFIDNIKITDLPRPSNEEVAKAHEQKLKDMEAAYDVFAALNVSAEVQLANPQHEMEQFRILLLTNKEAWI